MTSEARFLNNLLDDAIKAIDDTLEEMERLESDVQNMMLRNRQLEHEAAMLREENKRLDSECIYLNSQLKFYFGFYLDYHALKESDSNA